ncbi:Dyp-type peroxidase [Microbacterium album]|uniref:Peroxidase n=1 Tax=Microbacterium album TaxID=2053191 RepID=A0A917IFC2_9MICO|nr:Dyp-type peroxidase [Microbacterium album]GGH40889.1 hypothetical protein GCM10010921_13130 [Microbacterium album]
MTPGDGSGPTISRRGLLVGGGVGASLGLAAGGLAGLLGARATTTPGDDFPTAGEGAGPVPARGRHQAGIARPDTPQRHTVLVVADLDGEPDAAAVRAALAAAGDAVDALTDPGRADPDVLPDGPGDLTITIGIGPRLVRAIDPALPGADPLPAFAGDELIGPEVVGGDLLVSACATDAAPLALVTDAVLDAIPGARRRWGQSGTRGAGEGTVARNPLGYHDGVIVPHGDAELDANVWIPDGPAAGGTIAVVRRLRLDVAAFRSLAPEARDHVIGREHRSGAPLSGGSLHDEADLTAKTPEGEFLVPLRSHVRAAHPSFTNSALMLRRGYAYSNGTAGEPDEGLLFVCFQRDLETFVRTQLRLDETDDLMRFVTTTASASFLVLPGRTGDDPLGAALF